MKSIELTEEHKSKLLEMCKVLFPKYELSFQNDNGDIGIIDININEIGRTTKYQDSIIHWFEFCITELAPEIANKRTEKSFGFDPWDYDKKYKKYLQKMLMFDEPEHPVDYLYKEFKKLVS